MMYFYTFSTLSLSSNNNDEKVDRSSDVLTLNEVTYALIHLFLSLLPIVLNENPLN
jgi:hypothetical protein